MIDTERSICIFHETICSLVI